MNLRAPLSQNQVLSTDVWPKSALVISTYNNPEYLKVCLESLVLQKDKDFHIFIADDGSTQETKNLIQTYQKKLKNPIHHFWHEDQGYRKAKIHNQVFNSLHCFDIIISMDGDTFVDTCFISDHKSIHRLKKNNHTLFMGRRVDLNQALTNNIMATGPATFFKTLPWKRFIYWWKNQIDSLTKTFRIQNNFLRWLLRRHRVYDLLGSNFSVSKDLLFKINGYNEEFKSYWGEDGDFFVRARNAGAELVGLKSFANQFHLYHTRREPDKESQNYYFNVLVKNNEYKYCQKGMDQN